MGLNQLCREIEQNAKVRAAQIAIEAKEEAKAIAEDAKAQAKEKFDAASAQAHEFSVQEASERITAAQLEAQKILSDAKDDAVGKCLLQVWDDFSQARKKAGYAKNMRSWADLALQELDYSGATLKCAAQDRQILASAKYKVSSEPLECAGGLRAESKGSKVIVDYTLESIFEQKREEISKQIYSKLFSSEDEQAYSSHSAPSSQKKKQKERAGKKGRGRV